jgi:hypothetical protein
MRVVDWLVLGATLALVVFYGPWRRLKPVGWEGMARPSLQILLRSEDHIRVQPRCAPCW